MRKEGNVSKVAICPKCEGFVLASHIDYTDRKTEKEFTELTNEGFIVKLETIKETQSREMSSYKDCKVGNCKKRINN